MNAAVVELRVERVARDVGDLTRKLSSVLAEHHSAEGALVREQHTLTVIESEGDGQVLRLAVAAIDAELAAHAEMAQHGVSSVQGEPEVLAAATHVVDSAAGEAGGEVVRPGGMPADGPRMKHVDRGDGAAHEVLGESTTDDLDLGELRQCCSPPQPRHPRLAGRT